MQASATTPQVDINQATGGANIPDATHRLEDILLVSLMTPNLGGDPRLNCDMGLPTFLWGLSGIAKSAIIKQTAKKLSLPVEIVYPGTHMPEDFSSLPVVLQDKLVAACMLPQINILNESPYGGLLFLDEASNAAPAVQGSMLGMVLERQVGSVKIAPHVRILAAGNPPEYSAGGFALDAPFANRFAHFFVKKPPTERLTAYILSEGSHKVQPLSAPLAQLQQRWGEVWPKVKGLWVGLINARDSIRHVQPLPSNPQSGYCWPSDRTWEFAFRALATCRCLNIDSSVEALVMEACVGEGATSEYLAWAAHADLPDARDVLYKGWQIPRQLDRIHAVYAAITSLVVEQQEGPERYKLATLAWNRLQDLLNAGHSDIVTTHAQTLIGDGLGPTAARIPVELRDAGNPVCLKLGKVRGLVAQFQGV